MSKLFLVLSLMAFAKMSFGQSDLSIEVDYDFVYENGNTLIVRTGAFWGLVDKKGKTLVPQQYITFRTFGNTNTIAWKNKDEKWGILDSTNQIIAPFSYDYVLPLPLNENNVIAKKGNFWGVLDNTGKIIIPFDYQGIAYDYFHKNMFFATKNNKTGLINTNNEVVIPLLYNSFPEARSLNNVNYIVVRKDVFYGIINLKNEVIVPFEYSRLSIYSDSLICFIPKDNHYYGLMNFKNEVIIEPKYSKLNSFSEGLALVQKEQNGLYGFINTKGEEIIPFKYKASSDFKNGLASVSEDGKVFYFIDNQGNQVFQQTFTSIDYFDKKEYAIVDNGELGCYTRKMGIINRKGELLLPIAYHSIEDTWGYILAQNSNEIVLLDSLGKIKERYDACVDAKISLDRDAFPLGLQKNGKWGFVNKEMNTVIDFVYDNVTTFYNSKEYRSYKSAQVCKKEKCGLIDCAGKILIPLEYEFKYDFRYARLMVAKKNGKMGLIDKYNKIEIPFEYDYIEAAGRLDYFKLSKDRFWGIANQKGEIVVPIIYDYIDLQPNLDYLRVNKNEKQGIINFKNETLISLVYDRIEVINPVYAKSNFEKNEGFSVEINDKKGFVSNKNILVTPCEYEKIESAGNVIFATLGDKIHAYAFDGKILTKNKTLHYPISLGENKAWATIVKGNYYSIIFPDGTYLPCIYDNIEPWWENRNFVFVTNGSNKTAILNMKGEKVRDFEYASYGSKFSNFLIYRNENYKYGAMDCLLQPLISPIYDKLMAVDNKLLFAVNYITSADKKKLNGLQCIAFDSAGKQLEQQNLNTVQEIFLPDALDKERPIFLLLENTTSKLIGVYSFYQDMMTIPSIYQKLIFQPKTQVFIAQKEGKYGVIDAHNDIKIPLEYEKIVALENGNFKVTKKGEMGKEINIGN